MKFICIMSKFDAGRYVFCDCENHNGLVVETLGEETTLSSNRFRKIASNVQGHWFCSISRCLRCGRVWLVSEESRLNDLIFGEQISEKDVIEMVENKGSHPLMNYSTLLKLGMNGTARYRYLDFSDKAFICMVQDVLKSAPETSVDDLAILVNAPAEVVQGIIEMLGASSGHLEY